MPTLKNVRHERFCQLVVSGLSHTEAYTAAGYSGLGAKQSAARLLADADVRTRIAELRDEIESSFVRLQIRERDQRLQALQDRWDALRGATAALAREDYAAAMKTGVVVRKLRWIGGKDGYEIIEYEINSALIECLNSVEKRAAIETGQEVDRQDIKLRGGMNDQAEIIRKTFTWEEMRVMQDRMHATIEAERTGKVVEVQADTAQETPKSPSSGGVGEAPASNSLKSWRD